jgi:hypothetical protein
MKDINYYENTESAKQKAYVKLQCNCVLCSTALELKFETTTDGEIKEEATCPQCEIRTRAKIHSLQ